MEKMEENFSLDLIFLNSKEINKLKSFLKTIQNDGSWSLAHQDPSDKPSGKFTYSVILPPSNTDKNDTWILNSEAIDYMTPNSHVFITINPLRPQNKFTLLMEKQSL